MTEAIAFSNLEIFKNLQEYDKLRVNSDLSVNVDTRIFQFAMRWIDGSNREQISAPIEFTFMTLITCKDANLSYLEDLLIVARRLKRVLGVTYPEYKFPKVIKAIKSRITNLLSKNYLYLVDLIEEKETEIRRCKRTMLTNIIPTLEEEKLILSNKLEDVKSTLFGWDTTFANLEVLYKVLDHFFKQEDVVFANLVKSAIVEFFKENYIESCKKWEVALTNLAFSKNPFCYRMMIRAYKKVDLVRTEYLVKSLLKNEGCTEYDRIRVLSEK